MTNHPLSIARQCFMLLTHALRFLPSAFLAFAPVAFHVEVRSQTKDEEWEARTRVSWVFRDVQIGSTLTRFDFLFFLDTWAGETRKRETKSRTLDLLLLGLCMVPLCSFANIHTSSTIEDGVSRLDLSASRGLSPHLFPFWAPREISERAPRFAVPSERLRTNRNCGSRLLWTSTAPCAPTLGTGMITIAAGGRCSAMTTDGPLCPRSI